MKNLEVKKTVSEILDKLCEREEGQELWNSLSTDEESELENSIQKIIEQRLIPKKNSTIERELLKEIFGLIEGTWDSVVISEDLYNRIKTVIEQ